MMLSMPSDLSCSTVLARSLRCISGTAGRQRGREAGREAGRQAGSGAGRQAGGVGLAGGVGWGAGSQLAFSLCGVCIGAWPGWGHRLQQDQEYFNQGAGGLPVVSGSLAS